MNKTTNALAPLKFGIEQIAINPRNPARARQLLIDLGMVNWVDDQVKALGQVFGEDAGNIANLAFNYEAFSGKEFEILNYVEGDNWLEDAVEDRANTVTHLGMHCSADDLIRWREFFAERGIGIAQEVFTQSHTNPFLVENGRKYNYVIFDTKSILGVDLKFIVRINKEDQ